MVRRDPLLTKRTRAHSLSVRTETHDGRAIPPADMISLHRVDAHAPYLLGTVPFMQARPTDALGFMLAG